MTSRPVILAGPTASGKSALALRIAERDDGCIINADASQVYACWRILTARPTDDDLARAPHRLYGHVACDARYSVGAWLSEVAAALDEARGRGQRPVIVGGTGLYISKLMEGIAAIPETPAEFRERSEALLGSGQADVLLRDLARRDPATLELIDRNNPRRVQRAWEVLMATGRGLSDWQRSTEPPLLKQSDAVCVVVSPDLSNLNRAIEGRFREMVQLGAIDECRRFIRDGHDQNAPSGRVLGAAQLMGYLAGRLELDDAIDLSIVATRQFAKRQRTWFRNRLPDWSRLDPAADLLAQVPTR